MPYSLPMAYEISNGAGTPHATSHSDLLAKIRTFANANSAVEQEYVAGDRYITKLVGGGSDAIYFGLKVFTDGGAAVYGLVLQGYTGFQAGQAFDSQLGAIASNPPALASWNSTISYWLFLNTRRLIVVTKISGTYHMAYCGLILPYGTPAQWVYPLLIGGSTYRGDTDNSGKPYAYSVSNAKVTNFWNPINSDSSQGTLAIRDGGGSWVKLLNTIVIGSYAGKGTFPYLYSSRYVNARKTVGGNDLLRRIDIAGNSPANRYGYFDGMFQVAGDGLTAEQTITVGGDTYLVFPNVSRTAGDQWVAIKQA